MSHLYSGTKPAPVNATEMGKLVGLSRQKIVALHEDGAIPAEVAEGRTYRFDPDKVRAALAARAAKT